MPEYLIGVKKDILTFVKVNDAPLYYGFSTKDFANLPNVSAADTAALGHLLVSNVPANSFKVIGAQSPKPPRMRKTINDNPSATEQASISTFCAFDKIAAAQAEGWKLASRGRGVKFTNNTRTVTVAAKLSNGMYYAIPLNKNSATKYAGTLGLQLPEAMTTAERKKTVTGSSLPKPAVMAIETTGTNGQKGTFSTICSFDSVDNATSAGWEQLEPEVLYA